MQIHDSTWGTSLGGKMKERNEMLYQNYIISELKRKEKWANWWLHELKSPRRCFVKRNDLFRFCTQKVFDCCTINLTIELHSQQQPHLQFGGNYATATSQKWTLYLVRLYVNNQLICGFKKKLMSNSWWHEGRSSHRSTQQLRLRIGKSLVLQQFCVYDEHQFRSRNELCFHRVFVLSLRLLSLRSLA